MAGVLKMRVSWKATPDQVRRAFAKLTAGLNDWTPAMVRMRQVFSAMFREIFASSGSTLDGTWDQPTPETMRRKLRGGGAANPATLRATGALEASLVSDSADGAIRRVVQPGQGVPRFVWGTTIPYAAPLQFGSQKRGMAARRFVGLTSEAQDEIRDILQEQLSRRMDETAAALGGRS